MSSRIVLCYSGGSVPPDSIDGSLMTHLVCGWTKVDSATGTMIPGGPADPDIYRRSVQLRQKWPNLRVMVSCASSLSATANSPVMLSTFVQTALVLLNEFDLDGLDLDWEFPVFNGQPYDKANCVALLRKLRAAFDTRGKPTLLTMATSASKRIIDVAYDIPAMAPYLDFVNMMGYDLNLFTYYNVWASHNAPMYKRPEQLGFFATNNVSWAAEYWVQKGMPRQKVVVGIPTYGRTWKLLVSWWHGYNAVCVGAGPNPQISYPQAIQFLRGGGTRVFDTNAQVPYAYQGRDWLSFEDEESITGKAQWIRKQGFGGAMIFSLDADDWNGSLGGKAYPLISIVSETLSRK